MPRIPVKPVRLPGTLWAISSYYNPCSYHSRYENYQIFQKKLRKQGVPLFTVECDGGRKVFDLNQKDADLLVQVRGDAMWQKGRLLNIAVGRLPDDCDKVVWVDADIFFHESKWARRLCDSLEKYIVVQPYSRVKRLFRDRPETGRIFNMLMRKFYVRESRAFLYARYGIVGEKAAGFTWGMRRSLLEKHGFYDRMILGGADKLLFNAFLGTEKDLQTIAMAPKLYDHAKEWIQRVYQDVEGSVHYLKGDITHLWHGEKEDRLYRERHQILSRYDFDALHDIKIGESGGLVWSSDKKDLHQAVKRYFELRKEDG